MLSDKNVSIYRLGNMYYEYQLNQEQIKKLNKEIIKKFCKEYKILFYLKIDNDYQDKHTGNTIAMYLAYNKRIPSKYWFHNPLKCNNRNDTVAIILAYHGIIPPKEWYHIVSFKNNDGKSIKYLLDYNQAPIYHHLINDSMNSFDQACFRQIPDVKDNKPDDQDEDGWTVAMILAYNNIEIPYCWHHNPTIQNKYGFTVAMIQAKNGKIPDKHWIHDKYLRCKYNQQNNIYCNYNNYNIQCYTVQNILQEKHIEVPDEWKYQPLYMQEDSQDIIDARNGTIPKFSDSIPQYQNINGDTVAIILAKQGIIPSKNWMHDITITNKYNQSLKSTLQDKQLPIPQNLYQNNMTIFDQACFRIIPDIQGRKPNEQNEDGFTVAMILAINNVEIPQCWHHEPNIQNKYGYTVAMYQARNGIIPHQCWNHNPTIQDNNGETVAIILLLNKIQVPKQWKYNAMFKNKNDNTVEDILISNKQQIPKEWQVNSERVLSDQDKKIIDDYCKHYYIKTNYNISTTYNINYDNYTIGEYLASIDIIPPKQWMHDVDMSNRHGESIRSILQHKGYIYKNEEFVQGYKTQILNDKCQICFAQGEQEFILTNCNHKICIKCIKSILTIQNIDKCPICNSENWYEKIQSEQNNVQQQEQQKQEQQQDEQQEQQYEEFYEEFYEESQVEDSQ